MELVTQSLKRTSIYSFGQDSSDVDAEDPLWSKYSVKKEEKISLISKTLVLDPESPELCFHVSKLYVGTVIFVKFLTKRVVLASI